MRWHHHDDHDCLPRLGDDNDVSKLWWNYDHDQDDYHSQRHPAKERWRCRVEANALDGLRLRLHRERLAAQPSAVAATLAGSRQLRLLDAEFQKDHNALLG